MHFQSGVRRAGCGVRVVLLHSAACRWSFVRSTLASASPGTEQREPTYRGTCSLISYPTLNTRRVAMTITFLSFHLDNLMHQLVSQASGDPFHSLQHAASNPRALKARSCAWKGILLLHLPAAWRFSRRPPSMDKSACSSCI